jgi:hypothetical protein
MAQAPPRHPGVLNKGLGSDRPPSAARERGQRLIANPPAKPSPSGAILGERAGGPNAAHPDTQTVSNNLYLRPEQTDGKLTLENTGKTSKTAVSLKPD